MKKIFRSSAIASALALSFAGAASAGTLTFQGVTFTTSSVGNVLTLEIDAAGRDGDWATATTIGALSIKEVGDFTSVDIGGLGAGWTFAGNELNANGCVGGLSTDNACFFGTHMALGDDMVFTFTYNGGTQDFTAPHLKVNFFVGDDTKKVGSLLSAAIPEPETYGLMLAGLGVLGFLSRRRQQQL